MSRLALFLAGTLVPGLCAAALGAAADTMFLTDAPGSWFRSQRTGTPVAVVNAGQRVDFVINDCCTNTRHTVTVLVQPEGANLRLDQDQSQKGTISATFRTPGVYVIVCKIHPYMVGVVAVKGRGGKIPDVTAGSLPFVGHLGARALPPQTVVDVLMPVAPDDAAKQAKWDLRGPQAELIPSVPGVGEIWLNAQFERVPGQTDNRGVLKPGTIVVVDAATFRVEREIDGRGAGGQWNNPHNLWADFALDTVYNTNWFGKWLNKIDRQTGRITDSITVGEAPTHVITIPTPGSPELGDLVIPLSADKNVCKVQDEGDRMQVVDKAPSGEGKTHPHGHWLTCGRGDRIVVPNTFKGLGVAGSISIMDTASGAVLKEFEYAADDPLRSALLFPIAAGECHVRGVSKAYVANAVSGFVTVIDVDAMSILKNIPVTLAPDGQAGLDLLHTLQVPVQTPVSPDERFVGTAVMGLTNVRGQRPAPDHVAIIDTARDEVVALVPTPGGTHGANWGAKRGGGYYLYVTAQWSNVLTVLDPDPNGDGHGGDAKVVGTILLANGSPGAGVTDGTGGQGIKPLPLTHDGWIQPTVALAESGATSEEVRAWIDQLTAAQKNPEFHSHAGE